MTYKVTIITQAESEHEALENIGTRLLTSQETGWLRDHGIDLQIEPDTTGMEVGRLNN